MSTWTCRIVFNHGMIDGNFVLKFLLKCEWNDSHVFVVSLSIGATRGVLGGASAPPAFYLAPPHQNHQKFKNHEKNVFFFCIWRLLGQTQIGCDDYSYIIY